MIASIHRHAKERDLPPLEPRAAVASSACVVSAKGAVSVLRGDAVVEALALLPSSETGRLVISKALSDEAAHEIAAARAQRTSVPAKGTRPELLRFSFIEDDDPPARAKPPSPATTEDARAGLRYEDLEIQDTIGRGATSVVRLARHKKDGRKLALKLQHAPEERARSRWERELRAYSKVEGVPGIVPLRGHGVQGFELWMALDYVEGESLEQRLAAKGPLPVREAAAVLSRIARALHASHTRGVIHRDVKPGNVVVDAKGESWLLDFGIARFEGEDKGPSGLYAGTLGYLPPEAFDDPPILDARSDVYSLGASFFELVSGRMPFGSATGQELIVQVVSRSSPLLHEVARGATADAAAIARCALRKLPQDRYRNAGEMALDLDLVSKGQTPLHAPPLDVDSGTTFRFRDLFQRRAVDAVARNEGPGKAK
jgi:serine/threonine protein kinase